MTETSNLRKTSIIIPCHNYGQYLSWAIQSTIHQSSPPKEILVINDSSTDNTHEVSNNYKDKIRYFHVDFHCAQKTRNFGLSQATGEYILFLDADDFLDNQALKLLEAELNANDKLKLVYSGSYRFGARELISKEGFQFSKIPDSFDLERLRKWNYIPMPSLFRKHGFLGFDPKIERFQDWDAWLSYLSSNAEAKCIPLPLHHVRFHGKNKTLTVNYYSARFKVLLKHKILGSYSNTIKNSLPTNTKNSIPPKSFIIAFEIDNSNISYLFEFLQQHRQEINGVIIQTNNKLLIQSIETHLKPYSLYIKFETNEKLDALFNNSKRYIADRQPEWLIISDFSTAIKPKELSKYWNIIDSAVVSPVELDLSLGLKQNSYIALNREALKLVFSIPIKRQVKLSPHQSLFKFSSNLWNKYIGWRFK